MPLLAKKNQIKPTLLLRSESFLNNMVVNGASTGITRHGNCHMDASFGGICIEHTWPNAKIESTRLNSVTTALLSVAAEGDIDILQQLPLCLDEE